NVREPRLIGVLEKDKIAWLPRAPIDPSAGRRLPFEPVSDINAQDVEDDELGEAGAVEPGRCVASPDIRIAEVVEREGGETLPVRRRRRAWLRGRLWRRSRRRRRPCLDRVRRRGNVGFGAGGDIPYANARVVFYWGISGESSCWNSDQERSKRKRDQTAGRPAEADP